MIYKPRWVRVNEYKYSWRERQEPTMTEKKQVWMDMDGYLFIRFWTERYGYVLEDEHGLWPDHELMWCGYWHCLGEL